MPVFLGDTASVLDSFQVHAQLGVIGTLGKEARTWPV
jgi:hypothetical protein